ncbi:MAG: HAMP domain-containing histidine kinase [Lachnospiraceae bacterium]|nr:HAMP domain-containing histidine kinase [Lachnospiraceae bacterium]
MVMYMIIGMLALAVVMLAFRIYQYKRQIRSFARATAKRKSTDWNQLVTVDYFDKDILELAEVLNAYTDMHKELEKQYEKDRRQLKNVIAGISHDFRTPLTAAKGYLQMLEKSTDFVGKEKEYLDIAIDKVAYLKHLSDDFFEISSLEAKEEKLEISTLNVGNFLSECILQQHGWIEEQGIRTDFQLPKSDVFLETNEHDLMRMMENLFSNVRKYVKSYVGVKAFLEGDVLVILVENDLEGMEVPDTDRIFEPFYRDSARTNEGSGLGLYVVDRLAKRLGIETEAECMEGVFRMALRIKTGVCREESEKGRSGWKDG